MKSLKSPTVHNFPQKSRPLKPITVLFLQLVSLWVGNCFYNFITFKALAYLNSTDRILPLACSGRELMEKETIEFPWRFRGERSSCTRIISKALLLSCHSFLWLLHCAFHLLLFWNCSKYFIRVDSFITFQLFSVQAPFKWSFHSFLPWQCLAHFTQHCIKLRWVLNKQMWLAGAIGHDAPTPLIELILLN